MPIRLDGWWQLFYSKPGAVYIDTKANIEALAGISAGAIAVATDNPSAPFGAYVSGSWSWVGGGGGGTWGTITGDIEDQEDLSLILNRVESKQKKDYSRIKKSSSLSKVFSNSNFI